MNRSLSILLACGTLAAPTATAQTVALVDAPRPELSLLAGYTSYDLSGTGSAVTAGAFIDYPVLTFLRLEAGAGFLRYKPQGTTTSSTLLFPELGLRAGVLVGTVQPYVGAGLGVAATVSGGGGSDLTLHGLAGLKFLLGPRFSVKGELRVRSVDPFHGTTADFMGGVVLGL